MKTACRRDDFPLLARKDEHGRRLVYLDSAATTQKPAAVIQAVARHYRETNANPHRGVYTLSVQATAALEDARARVAKFIGARDPHEIVFTKNATEAFNLLAHGLRPRLQGKTILTTRLEHHANFLPWLRLAQEAKAKLDIVDIDDDGRLRQDQLEEKIDAKPALVTFTQVSNALGTRTPARDLVRAAHETGALAIIDGSQAAPHEPVDVHRLGCDAYAFSAHKMLAPAGLGVLWARMDLLEAMEPLLVGGDMVATVTDTKATWNPVPGKFEAGTPNVEAAVGLHAALDYLDAVGMDRVRAHEQALTAYALKRLAEVEGVTRYGPLQAKDRSGSVAFNLDGVHGHDVAQVLSDARNVCIRSGHHCAQPLHRRLGVPATARASFHLYNDETDVDELVDGLADVKKAFQLA